MENERVYINGQEVHFAGSPLDQYLQAREVASEQSPKLGALLETIGGHIHSRSNDMNVVLLGRQRMVQSIS